MLYVLINLYSHLTRLGGTTGRVGAAAGTPPGEGGGGGGGGAGGPSTMGPAAGPSNQPGPSRATVELSESSDDAASSSGASQGSDDLSGSGGSSGDPAERAQELAEVEEEADVDASYIVNGFDEVRGWLEKCQSVWRRAYEPGTFMVVDESMIMWVG